MSTINNGGLDQYGKAQSLNGSGAERVKRIFASQIFAVTGRQPLLSVITSQCVYLSVCLSVYVCRPVRPVKLPQNRLTPGVMHVVDRRRVYVIYFPAHCAGVINMSSRYNLSPAACEDEI